MVILNEKQKPVFAGFLNMARQNAFVTMCHISKLMGVGISGQSEENNLKGMSVLAVLKGRDAEKKQKLCALLEKHFPFLRPMDDAMKMKVAVNGAEGDFSGGYYRKDLKSAADTYYEILTNVFTVLNFYRNYSTHYDPDEDDRIESLHAAESVIVYKLFETYKSSLFVVQQRFGYTEEQMNFAKLNMIKPNYRCILHQYIDEYGNIFKPDANTPKEAIKGKKRILSYNGLVLFASLFLHKKYISELHSKLKYSPFPVDSDITYLEIPENERFHKSVILEAFSIYRINLPQERLASMRSDIALGLDMLNELQKCPKELYNLLDPEDRELFHAENTGETSDGSAVTKMIRHSDRFPYLAMRYIDEMNIFENARFQVSLGNYRFAFYNKKCIDRGGEESADRVRSLQMELNGFGRIDEIEQARKNEWGEYIRDFEDVREDTSETLPYITDERANYIINANRVGIWYPTGKNPHLTSSGLPVLPENPKEVRYDSKGKVIRPDVTMTKPRCFVSVYELPAMLFYNHLYQKLNEADKTKSESVEKYIKSHVAAVSSVCKGICDGEITPENHASKLAELNVELPHLPEKLQDYLTGKDVDMDKRGRELLQKRLHGLIVETKQEAERFESRWQRYIDKKNRRGKSGFTDIRSGELAVWLADDIVKMQPCNENGTNKLTGLNASVMQAVLAVYEDTDVVKRTLAAAGLLTGTYPHPFLNAVIAQNPQNTVQFYKYYLEEKLRYLQSLEGKIKYDKDCLKSLTFLRRGVKKWEDRTVKYYMELAGRYLDNPVELPRGLFKPQIERMLAALNCADVLKSEAGRTNAAYLIARYFDLHLNDGSQEFYELERIYPFVKTANNDPEGDESFVTAGDVYDLIHSDCAELIDDIAEERTDLILEKKDKKLKNNKEKQEILERVKSGLKRDLKEMRTVEKHIRRYKVQDMLIFLMAKDILLAKDNGWNNIEDFKLKSVKPVNAGGENILNRQVRFSVTLTLKGGKTVDITQNDLKVKNYGDFYRFLNDSRIATLLPYLEKGECKAGTESTLTVTRAEIEDELQAYDGKRVPVFEIIQRMEKKILSAHPQLKDRKSAEYKIKGLPKRNNFRTLLAEYGNVGENLEAVVKIRNSFGHNCYASPDVLTDNEKSGNVAEKIYNRIEKMDKK